MHALYGARPNVAPPMLGDIGILETDFIRHEETDDNGDMEEDWENVNPNEGMQRTPTEILSETLEGIAVGMNGLNGETGQHASTCTCKECRNFVEVNSGDTILNGPYTATQGDPPVLQNISSNGPAAPRRSAPKTPVQAAKEAVVNSKPTFTAIYVDRIKEKGEYQKELITSRDKWKMQDLEDRKLARLEAMVEKGKESRLARKHQLHLESVHVDIALKKAKFEYDHAVELAISKLNATQEHEKDMAKATCRTALLTTLFGSNKFAEEIKSLLPIVDQSK